MRLCSLGSIRWQGPKSLMNFRVFQIDQSNYRSHAITIPAQEQGILIVDMARRSFLRGRPGAPTAALRPPWALAEAEFTERCTRCGDCVTACPTGLLKATNGGFPVADFTTSFCDFCGHCVDACRPGALVRGKAVPWDLQIRISDSCLTHENVVCRSCGEACTVGAIRFPPRLGGVAQPEVDAANCTGCGECLPTCPTRAITIGHPLPGSEETT